MLWAVSMVSGGGANTWVGHHGCSPVSTAPAYGGGFTPTNTLEGVSSPRKGLFRSKQGSDGNVPEVPLVMQSSGHPPETGLRELC